MPDLLVRNVDAETKKRLSVRAASNGRSVQAEACTILTEAVSPQRPGIVALLKGCAGSDLDGFEIPERHPARDFSLE